MWFHKFTQVKPIVRYSIVVGVVFVIDLGVFWALVKFGFSVYISNAIAFFIGTLINILLFRRVVFSQNRFSLLRDIVLSLCVYAMVFALGMGLLWVFFSVVGLGEIPAKVLANGFTFVVNYLIRALLFTRS